MKILQIIQRPQLRGAEIFACQLSEVLKTMGHTIDVLYLFGNGNQKLEFNLNFQPLGATQSKRFWDFKAYKKLATIIDKEDYDIVQANAGDTLKYAAISKRLYNWQNKLVFRNANKMTGFIKSTPHLWLNQFFLNQIDYAISVSENCRQDLIKILPKANSISATGTIGTFDFTDLKAIEKSSDNKIWINVGSIVKEKNHRFLLEVFATYIKDDSENELWMIGDGPLRKHIEEQAKKLGIQQKVKFLGYQKDAVAYIKAADIMVMPSMIEGLPGVILEALSCGKPVIASSVGGIPEVVHNGLNGYVIEEFDTSAYQSRIREVLNDQNLREEMGRNAQKLIDREFLMPKISRHFQSIYKDILGQ